MVRHRLAHLVAASWVLNVQALRTAFFADPRPPPQVDRGYHPDWKHGVQLIKIQKTASSSLGDDILPTFCPLKTVCNTGLHNDWFEATRNGTYDGPVVTMLRNPIERALSEFFYLRDNDGHNSMMQAQWDFNNNVWLKKIQDADINKAFDAYVHGYPDNPSRNRQALYILGFRKFGHKQEARKHAGGMYNWDSGARSYVVKAMEHLENLTAFGIVECWASSMRAIARGLKWDEDAMVDYAESTHQRNWHGQMVSRKKPDFWKLEEITGKEIPANGTWAAVVPRDWVVAVKKWSHVDIMLYEAAKKRFVEKFGLPCD